jgi:hypothetical protein
MKFATVILGILTLISTASAIPTTDPSAVDPPAPAAMAPSYISIGQELRLRVALVRRTLDDLSLDPAIRQQADRIVDAEDADLKKLLADVQSGQMPGYHRLMSVPDDLRACRAKLMVVIGPQKGELLQEKLRSLRGEARGQCGWLCQQIDELNLSAPENRLCQQILGGTEVAVEKLPDSDVSGDQYAAARNAMDAIFTRAHDALTKVLSAAEQSRLGPHFAQLDAQSASTQPSAGG